MTFGSEPRAQVDSMFWVGTPYLHQAILPFLPSFTSSASSSPSSSSCLPTDVQPPRLAVVINRSPHQHNLRQHLEKHRAHPIRHGVGHRRAVVHIQHEHGDDDAECDEDHCEEQVLSNERDDQRGGGDGLGDNEQEDSEGEQDGDTERDLLSTVGREIENQHREERDEEAGDDQVDGVKERQPPDVQGVGDVWVDLFTAVVLDIMLVARSVNDFPLSALPEVFQIHLVMDKDLKIK